MIVLPPRQQEGIEHREGGFRSSLSRLASACLLGMFLMLALVPEVRAHSTGENYVWLNVEEQGVRGRFEIRLADLRRQFNMEVSTEYEPALRQIRAGTGAVQEYIRDRFRITVKGKVVRYQFTGTNLLRSDAFGHFAQYEYQTEDFQVPDELGIENELFLGGDNDRLHRSLIVMEHNRKTGVEYGSPSEDPSKGESAQESQMVALVFGPRTTRQTLNLKDTAGLVPTREFLWQGVLHIWIGIDHILFLLALLLPAVLVAKEGEGWEGVPGFQAAFWNVLKIVTLFTLAHSISLSVAALDLVQLPGRYVESAIALSIVVVALNNVFRFYKEGTGLVIFLFGLFHGLGFATVLGHLPFRMVSLIKVLLLFNVGVELGQAAIVLVAFPLIFFLRRTRFYVPVVLHGGSLVIAIVGAWWFYERITGP